MTSHNGTVDFEIKRGDVLPTMVIRCLNGETSVDLTTASLVKIKGRIPGASSLLFDRTVTGDANGDVTLVWQSADTIAAGDLYVEVEATFAGGKQTFPRKGYVLVRIYPDAD